MNEQVLQIILLTVLIAGGLVASYTDVKEGKVFNGLVVVLLGSAAVLDGVYYCWFAKDLFLCFLINALVCTVVLLCLFYTHFFAGGDVKLGLALVMLYPANCYVYYKSSLITLFFALCFGIALGYFYLLFTAGWGLIRGKTRINAEYVKSYLRNYFKNYLRTLIYIVAINLCAALIKKHGVPVNTWIIWVLCFVTAWNARRVDVLKNRIVIVAVVVLDIGLSIVLHVFPLSINPSTYLFVAVLLLCQLTIVSSIYKEIPTELVEEGMILSTYTSMQMQSSRVRGIPGVSKEDLRDRLTKEQAESIKRWGKTAKGTETIMIMRKIPYAIFLVFGFVIYFLMWGASKWC